MTQQRPKSRRPASCGSLPLVTLLLCSALQQAPAEAGGAAVATGNAKTNGMQLLNGQWGAAKYDSAEATATLDSLVKSLTAVNSGLHRLHSRSAATASSVA